MAEPYIYQLNEGCYKYRNGAVPNSGKTAIVNKIEYDPYEGFLTYFNGLKYPRPVVLNFFALRASDSAKKYLKGWMKVLTSPLHPFRAWLFEYEAFAFNELQEYVLLEEYWPRAVKEINRIAHVMGFRDEAIEPTCVILDQDLAYRWPLQDILSILDKKAMQRNPAKELMRLWKIFNSRWHHEEGKWNKVNIILWILVKCSSNFRNKVKHFAKELDIENIKLSDNDLYNCLLQTGYDYLGLNQAQRSLLHENKFGKESNQ